MGELYMDNGDRIMSSQCDAFFQLSKYVSPSEL